MELTIVDDGRKAVEALRKKYYDVILMDLQMPEMDGYEATFEIRKMDDARKRNIPIIALTAAALKEVRGQVFAAGMNDYITKPFNPVDLKKKLAEAIAG